jgi:hypothetical protein
MQALPFVAVQVLGVDHLCEVFYRYIQLQAFIQRVFKIVLILQPKGEDIVGQFVVGNA